MSAELYRTYFGLSERPFSLSPDPGFLFLPISCNQVFSFLKQLLVICAPLKMLAGPVDLPEKGAV